MGKRRTLNQDYFKTDAKYMRRSAPEEQITKVYKVVNGNIKKPVSGRTDVGTKKI